MAQATNWIHPQRAGCNVATGILHPIALRYNTGYMICMLCIEETFKPKGWREQHLEEQGETVARDHVSPRFKIFESIWRLPLRKYWLLFLQAPEVSTWRIFRGQTVSSQLLVPFPWNALHHLSGLATKTWGLGDVRSPVSKPKTGVTHRNNNNNNNKKKNKNKNKNKYHHWTIDMYMCMSPRYAHILHHEPMTRSQIFG